jgi:hypothetical protein
MGATYDDFFGGDEKAEFKARCDTNGTTPSVVSSFSAMKEKSRSRFSRATTYTVERYNKNNQRARDAIRFARRREHETRPTHLRIRRLAVA